MKRFRKVLPVIAAAVMMFTGCGKNQGVEVPSVLSDGVITVGLLNTNDRSCYAVTDAEGEIQYEGWEIEVLNLIDHYNENAIIEIKIADSREMLLSMLNSGEVDLAAGAFTRIDSYSQQYYISDDYGYGSIYLVNPRNGYLDTLAAFEDEVIGVSTQLSVNDVNKLIGIENVTQNQYSDISLLASDIENGIVAAGICTESEMVSIVSGTDLQACEMRSGSQPSLVFLTMPGQDKLMEWVNWGIDRHYYEMAAGIDSTKEEN
jgi:hypothetical protein